MLLNQLPAKKQGHICGEIQALRAREVELRKCFTDDCDSNFFEGGEFDVEVRIQKQRVLNTDRLPAAVLNDPQYFDLKYLPIMRVVPRKGSCQPLDFAPIDTVASNDNFDMAEFWAQ